MYFSVMMTLLAGPQARHPVACKMYVHPTRKKVASTPLIINWATCQPTFTGKMAVKTVSVCAHV